MLINRDVNKYNRKKRILWSDKFGECLIKRISFKTPKPFKMLLCIVILQRRVFSYFLNLFGNLFGEGLILYRTHFGKCFYCLNPCSLRRRLRDDESSSMWYRFHGIQGSREYLKLPTCSGPTWCFCAENQEWARPLKRLQYSNSGKRKEQLFLKTCSGCLAVRASLWSKQDPMCGVLI